MVAWIVLAPFHFGYGVSQLNALEKVWVCKPSTTTACLGMTEDEFGLATAMFTIGGTIASLLCAPAARCAYAGRRACLLMCASLALVSSLLLSTTTTTKMISMARLVYGLCAGIAIVQTPLYLQELAPPAIRGAIGTLNQLAVVMGIFTAQLVGTWAVTTHHPWQRVPQVSAAVALLQLIVGYVWACESPGWLEGDGTALGVGSAAAAAQIRSRLGCTDGVYERVHAQDAPILGADERPPRTWAQGIRIVVVTQVAQQLSGVNAIMYYSTGIMSRVLPHLAPFVGLLITLVNIVMTLPPLWLIDDARFGRRRLLLFSATSMGLCCFVLAWALMRSYAWLSSVSILLVMASFAVGLGPVPFVMLPEVLPPSHVSLGSSIGLGLNWLTNIVVALSFQPLRRLLGAWDGQTGSLVFVVLGVLNLAFASLIRRMYTT